LGVGTRGGAAPLRGDAVSTAAAAAIKRRAANLRPGEREQLADMLAALFTLAATGTTPSSLADPGDDATAGVFYEALSADALVARTQVVAALADFQPARASNADVRLVLELGAEDPALEAWITARTGSLGGVSIVAPAENVWALLRAAHPGDVDTALLLKRLSNQTNTFVARRGSRYPGGFFTIPNGVLSAAERDALEASFRRKLIFSELDSPLILLGGLERIFDSFRAALLSA
jgi:hypothetical protein